MNLKKDVLPLLLETWQEYQNDDAGQLGAALSYYATFSIFPLLLLLLASLGFVLDYWPVAIDAQAEILAVISQNFSPQLSTTVEQILGVLKNQAGAATGVGLVVLLLGASGVFQQLDTSFNKIWKVPQKPQASGIISTVLGILHDKLFSFGYGPGGRLSDARLADHVTGLSQALLGVLNDLPVVGGFFGYALGLLITLLLSTLILRCCSATCRTPRCVGAMSGLARCSRRSSGSSPSACWASTSGRAATPAPMGRWARCWC